MEITLVISVFLVCACNGAEEQLNFEAISQQLLNTGGSPYPQQEHFHQTETHKPVLYHDRYPDVSEKPIHYNFENPSRGRPEVIYHSQPESPTNYHSEPKELQLSQEIKPHRPSHATLIYPHVAVQSEPSQPQHTSLNSLRLTEPDTKPAEQESARQSTGPTNSRVVRDPRLPLYFTMYEKRIIQDPVDQYGKGPWRYLTYGHGITYGSKEPGKVFERGYGYIRALGRDHCKEAGNKCPRNAENKPFEYEGRKEPYFGYRPH